MDQKDEIKQSRHAEGWGLLVVALGGTVVSLFGFFATRNAERIVQKNAFRRNAIELGVALSQEREQIVSQLQAAQQTALRAGKPSPAEFQSLSAILLQHRP